MDFKVDMDFIKDIASKMEDYDFANLDKLNFKIPDGLKLTDLTKKDKENKVLDRLTKFNKRARRGENGSELTTVLVLKVVTYLTKIVKKFSDNKVSLDRWRAKFHARGFDLFDIRFKFHDIALRDKIAAKLRNSFPGSRHDFDKNPNVYMFLALHNKLGKVIRKKLGLEYMAYDDGIGGVTISVCSPPEELPFSQETADDLNQDYANSVEKEDTGEVIDPTAGIPGGEDGGMGGIGGMGGPPVGGGLPPGLDGPDLSAMPPDGASPPGPGGEDMDSPGGPEMMGPNDKADVSI